jgi:uncharacterized caspase-like protein
VPDASPPVSVVTNTSENDYAVVVGISNYPELENLPGAADDARLVAAWLTGPGGLPDENVALLVGDGLAVNAFPTRSDIDKAFGPLVQRIAGADQPPIRRLYIFVSGHGYSINTDSVVLLPADASRLLLGLAIDIRAYANAFRRSGRCDEVVLFADTSSTESPGAPEPAPPPWVLPRSPGPASNFFYGRAASFGGHALTPPPSETADSPHAFFTQALIEGLSGAAAGPDGAVTSSSLARYVTGEVLKRSEGRQQPSFEFDPFRPIEFRRAADLPTINAAAEPTDGTQSSKAEGQTPAATTVASADSVGESTEQTKAPRSWSAAPTPRIASDRWATRDTLGYEPFARTIATLITHADTVPPLTIGIKAPWGAGKTSLMKRVQYLIDGTASVTEENEAARRTRSLDVSMTVRQVLTALGRVRNAALDPGAATKSEAPAPGTASQPDVVREHGADRRRQLYDALARLRQVVSRTARAGQRASAEMAFSPPVPKASDEGTALGVAPRLTVWFNAWKYQTSEQIWAGLAHCIISQVTARMSALDRELFWLKLHASRVDTNQLRWNVRLAIFRELLPSLVFCIMLAAGSGLVLLHWVTFGVVGLGGASVVAIVSYVRQRSKVLGEKAAGAFKALVREPDYEGKLGFLHLVESDMREVLDLVATPTRPLVIFVDDLDRCAPHKVSEVVEAINLFLSGDYPNCVFVLGMEPAIVAAALEVANKDLLEKAQAFGVADDQTPLGWRFMEKIIQLPLAIPRPDAQGTRAYLAYLTGRDGASEGVGRDHAWTARIQTYTAQLQRTSTTIDEVVKQTEEMLSQAKPEDRTAIAEASKRAYAAKFTDRDPAITRFIEQTLTLFQGNPRQLKRYVNVFRFVSTLRHHLLMDRAASGIAGPRLPDDEALTKFVALSIQWPQAGDYVRMSRGEQGDGAAGEFGSMLAALEHGARDLRDHPAVAADALWEAYVKAVRLEPTPWLRSRQLREFLAQGASVGEFTGSGLW